MSSTSIKAASTALMVARRDNQGLPTYPGALPETLDEAYAIQSDASDRWGEPVVGWKVGRIAGDLATQYGADRFIGPIYASTVTTYQPGTVALFPAIEGGTAALEAEVIAILGQLVPPTRSDWAPEEVTPLLSGLHIGIEVAGCPVKNIGELGPLASIAAFGNNLGLIVGPAINNWQSVDINGIGCTSTIDGKVIGSAVASALPGGPLTAIAVMLNQAGKLGITLPAGTMISTGAITGVHPVRIGQTCVADFGDHGAIHSEVVDARG